MSNTKLALRMAMLAVLAAIGSVGGKPEQPITLAFTTQPLVARAACSQ